MAHQGHRPARSSIYPEPAQATHTHVPLTDMSCQRLLLELEIVTEVNKGLLRTNVDAAERLRQALGLLHEQENNLRYDPNYRRDRDYLQRQGLGLADSPRTLAGQESVTTPGLETIFKLRAAISLQPVVDYAQDKVHAEALRFFDDVARSGQKVAAALKEMHGRLKLLQQHPDFGEAILQARGYNSLLTFRTASQAAAHMGHLLGIRRPEMRHEWFKARVQSNLDVQAPNPATDPETTTQTTAHAADDTTTEQPTPESERQKARAKRVCLKSAGKRAADEAVTTQPFLSDDPCDHDTAIPSIENVQEIERAREQYRPISDSPLKRSWKVDDTD